MEKISFKAASDICHTLHKFYEARSDYDKDVILTIKKIHGEPTLVTTRLSKMSFCSRVIKWFGFGPATLKSVARFLQQHEPIFPSKFKDLQNKAWLECIYPPEDVEKVSNLSKIQYKKLKQQKIRGCERFLKCVAHHNEKHRKKVHVRLLESEKINLLNKGKIGNPGTLFYETYPQPLGLLPNEKSLNWIKEHFQAPNFKRKDLDLDPHVLGFCYEYGLGTPKNLDQAFDSYLTAYRMDPQNYSAAYNLARLYLQRGEVDQGIDTLRKIQAILLQQIQNLKEFAEKEVLKHQKYHKGPREEITLHLKKQQERVLDHEKLLKKPLRKVSVALEYALQLKNQK